MTARPRTELVDELLDRRRAPWPLRLDDDPLECFPTLGPVPIALIGASARLAGASLVALGLAARLHRRARG